MAGGQLCKLDCIALQWKSATNKKVVSMTRLKLGFSIFLFSALIGGVIAAEPSPTYVKAGNKAATFVNENGQKVVVTHFAGKQYRIPSVYFEPFGTKDYKDPEISMLIMASWPSLEALTSVAESQRSKLQILVNDAHSTTTFSQRFHITTGLRSPTTPLENKFGLKAFQSPKGSFGRVIEPKMPIFNGKKLVSSPTTLDKAGLYEQVFVDSQANPSVYIICIGDTAAPSPSCSEHFTDSGILYKVTFEKGNLKDWKAIKTSAIDLMKSFAK